MKSTIEKIRKLLALTESSNPHEASNAAEKARKLLLQHNLTMSDVEKKEESEVKGKLWGSGLKDTHWRTCLVSTVFEQFFCHLVTTPAGNWYIVGKPGNGEAAEVMIDYLLGKLEEAVSKRQKEVDSAWAAEEAEFSAMYGGYTFADIGRVKKPSYVWAEDFRLGWSMAVCRRLITMRESDSSDETALVVQENKEVEDFLQGIGAVNEPLKPPTGISKGDYMEGFREGEDVPLNQMIR